MTAWIYRLHRWLALLFALPLAIVIVSGLILSFEPAFTTGAIKPGSLSADGLVALIKKHDPQGSARRIDIRPYDNTMSILLDRRSERIVDMASGEIAREPGALPVWFRTARALHKSLLIDQPGIVTVSTVTMLLIVPIGPLMGWPRLRNTMAGWHKVAAWVTLPLIILIPLTGLAMVYKISFAERPTISANQRAMPVADAVRIISQRRDLSYLISLRVRRDTIEARIVENGRYQGHFVTPGGLVPIASNWPKLLHEGNWAGVWSAAANIVISLVMLFLLVTGLTLWVRRRLRIAANAGRRRDGAHQAASAKARPLL